MNKLCKILNCTGILNAKGLCRVHYRKLQRFGDPLGGPPIYNSVEERFWGKVNKKGPNECWEWRGAARAGGYGSFKIDGKLKMSHRVAYEFEIGPIPSGLVIDHLCRNHTCANPSHMEPVTNRENIRRGENFFSLKTHCPKGHPYNEQNTYRPPPSVRQINARHCRTCKNQGRLKWAAKQTAEYHAARRLRYYHKNAEKVNARRRQRYAEKTAQS